MIFKFKKIMKKYQVFALTIALFSFIACNQAQKNDMATDQQDTERTLLSLNGETLEPVNKSSEAWKQELTDQEYYVLREAGTERAFTSELLNNKEKGIYTCAGCGLPLFSSETKFKSGTGWPSFWKPIREEHIIDKKDTSYGMVRTENVCARCGGHLGHVFKDGPQPTGLRYCMNGVALDFVKTDQTTLAKK